MVQVDHNILEGIGVSGGTACATVVSVKPAPGPDLYEPPPPDVEVAGARVRESMAYVSGLMKARAEHAKGNAKPILEATAQLAKDRGLAKAVDKQLGKGKGMTAAVDAAISDYAALLQKLGGYMAERVTDLYDVGQRIICDLRGLPQPGIPQIEEPSILVARDLAPADTATLSPELVLGIITEEGGPTSHTAILAAQLGIPAVVRCTDAINVPDGAKVALDGSTGIVIVAPTDEEAQALQEKSRKRAEVLASSKGPGITKDGVEVKLLANIGTADDARKAAMMDVEGSGLFRTEFLFLGREEAPTLEEQIDTYTKVFEAFGDRRVVVRTLDAGADKPLKFANLGTEENPALGRRGLRLSMAKEPLLDTQLQALAQAYKRTGADVWVMAPMVATGPETRFFAERVRALGLPKVGIMIEVPAAALRARHLLQWVDFASIGTNDLSQYVMAADRMNGELADLLNPWQPAVLQLIGDACEGGRVNQASIGVCGEAGGDPLLALVLVGLGVKSLSMAPKKVAAVRASLAMHDMETCRAMAEAALTALGPKGAREAVMNMADESIQALF